MILSLNDVLSGNNGSFYETVTEEEAGFAKLELHEAAEAFESAMEEVNTFDCVIMVMESAGTGSSVQMEGLVDAVKNAASKLWEMIKSLGRFIKSFFVKSKTEAASAVEKTQAVAEIAEKQAKEEPASDTGKVPQKTNNFEYRDDKSVKDTTAKPEPAPPATEPDNSPEKKDRFAGAKSAIKGMFEKLGWIKMNTGEFIANVKDKVKKGLKLNEIDLDFDPAIISGNEHGAKSAEDGGRKLPGDNNSQNFNSLARFIEIFKQRVPKDIADLTQFFQNLRMGDEEKPDPNRISGYVKPMVERYRSMTDNVNALKTASKQKTKIRAIHIKAVYDDIMKVQADAKLEEIVSNMEKVIKSLNDEFGAYVGSDRIGPLFKSVIQALGSLTRVTKDVTGLMSACLTDIVKACEAYLKKTIDAPEASTGAENAA